MKKILSIISLMLLFLPSLSLLAQQNENVLMRGCLTTRQNHEAELEQNETYRKFVEQRLQKVAEILELKNPDCSAGPIIIPVAVHFDTGIVNPGDEACMLNVVNEQIAAINADFGATNPDISNYDNFASCLPASALGSPCIQFCLASANHPAGWGLVDGDPAVTFGDSRWNWTLFYDLLNNDTNGDGIPDALSSPDWAGYMNIFVGDGDNFTFPGILGLSEGLPGDFSGTGVFVNACNFGSVTYGGTACGTSASAGNCGTGTPILTQFDAGRTLTHEIGHYLGLFHIWGDELVCSLGFPLDGPCDGSDNISDTPDMECSYQPTTAGGGCPGTNCADSPATCDGVTDMWFNFMAYAGDACAWMFSSEQSDVMYANALAAGFSTNPPIQCQISTTCPTNPVITSADTVLCGSGSFTITGSFGGGTGTGTFTLTEATGTLTGIQDGTPFTVPANMGCNPLVYTITATATCSDGTNIVDPTGTNLSIDITVYPEAYQAIITPPDCSGGAGLVEIIAADGVSVCDSSPAGIAGLDGCPQTPYQISYTSPIYFDLTPCPQGPFMDTQAPVDCSCTGCTDPLACNFNPDANTDDGSCDLPNGCTDPLACNYDPAATCDDGSCDLPNGCTDPLACNYDASATCDDGSCDLPNGCTDPLACNYDASATCDDGSCDLPNGCTDPLACNYDSAATCDDGSCDLPNGCTDPLACNYDASATCDDGSCDLPNGCTDPLACNYDSAATCDDGSCDLPNGCTDATACNYDSAATCDDGSCVLPDGCTDPNYCEYNPSALCDDGSCVTLNVDPGCDDGDCTNGIEAWDPTSCQCLLTPNMPILGCTDATACNYDAMADCDDGTCEYLSCATCELEIPLVAGWNIISSCCEPANLNMEVVFAANTVDTNVIQVKNLTSVYVPSVPFNDFPDWDITQGYQVKVFNDDTLVINGGQNVDVNTNSIPLNTGWNIIAYWLNGEAEPLTVFAPLAPDVIQVKNLFGVVSPSVPFDGMGNMEKTQGYQVKMAAPGTLMYDTNDILPRVAGGANDQLTVGPNGKAVPQHFVKKDAPHFNNAAFIILDPQNGNLHHGDEMGIFSQDGILIGSMVYENDNMGGLVYGNDESIEARTGIEIGEEYVVKVWDKVLNEERIIDLNEFDFVQGNTQFEKDDLVIVSFKDANATTSIESIDAAQINAMPNPTSGEIVFDLQLPTAQNGISIQIFSVEGKLMEEITNQERVIAGQHKLPYNVGHLPNGVYLYKLVADGQVITANRFTVAK